MIPLSLKARPMQHVNPSGSADRSIPRPRSFLLVPLLAIALLVTTLVLLPPPPLPPVGVEDIQPPHQWQPGRLRVGVDASYPPFVLQVDGQYRGHDVELARRLADHLGLTLELVNIPFDGLYDALRVSRIDIIISALPYIEELDGTVIYSRPYFQAGEVLVVPRGSPVRDLGDLRNRTIGAELGSLGDQTARRLRAGGTAFTLRSDFDSAAAAVAALQAGEIDAVVTDRVAALALVRTDPTLTITGKPLSDVPYVMAMPYDTPDFARRVNNWLTALERDGTLARLTTEYLS